MSNTNDERFPFTEEEKAEAEEEAIPQASEMRRIVGSADGQTRELLKWVVWITIMSLVLSIILAIALSAVAVKLSKENASYAQSAATGSSIQGTGTNSAPHSSGTALNVPTKFPTRHPSPKPTGRPTNKPTYKPTGKPTKTPSVAPSQFPINLPSNSPSHSVRPTAQASAPPSQSPSASHHPTKLRSASPSKGPCQLRNLTFNRDPLGRPVNSDSQFKPVNSTCISRQWQDYGIVISSENTGQLGCSIYDNNNNAYGGYGAATYNASLRSVPSLFRPPIENVLILPTNGRTTYSSTGSIYQSNYPCYPNYGILYLGNPGYNGIMTFCSLYPKITLLEIGFLNVDCDIAVITIGFVAKHPTLSWAHWTITHWAASESLERTLMSQRFF